MMKRMSELSNDEYDKLVDIKNWMDEKINNTIRNWHYNRTPSALIGVADYCNDLNVLREALECLSEDEADNWASTFEFDVIPSGFTYKQTLTASARLRAIALVIVISLLDKESK